MEINIYTKDLSAQLIPEIVKRFADFHMDIVFHPGFQFDEEADTGFLPIRLKMQPGHSEQYDRIGYDILTGFELLFSDYDYEEELGFVQQPVQKKGFLSGLFGKKTPAPITEDFVADEETDSFLRHCKKNILLSWKSWNKSELRMGLYFAAIVAELTDGVIYDPEDGRYLSGSQALQAFPPEIAEYEQSLSEDEFTVDKYEGWVE